MWAEQTEVRAVADRQALLTAAMTVGAKDAEIPSVDRIVADWADWLGSEPVEEVDMVQWIRDRMGGG